MLAFSHLPRKIVNIFVCKWLKGSGIDGKRNIENVEEGVRFCSLSVGLQRPNNFTCCCRQSLHADDDDSVAY
jgi:hypothetical protein